MSAGRDTGGDERLPRGYETMLHRARSALGRRLPSVREAIEQAKDRAVELGELSRDEAERVGDYLHRDLKDAAAFLSNTGSGIADWLRLERDLIESRLLDSLAVLADQTRLEYERLAEQARRADERHTGDVVGPGTLRCTQCGEELRFSASGHVPPCPKCRATVFRRVASGD
jgi:hypothetical protein